MLQILYGNDASAVRTTLQKDVLATLSPEVEVQYIEADSFQPGQLREAVHGTSLFGASYLYVLDTPSESQEFQTELEQVIEALRDSDETFVVLEAALTAAQKKFFSQYTKNSIDCSITKPKRADAFKMANCLVERNKRGLWLELQTARDNGLPAEEIIGTLWWQLKTVRVAAQTTSASEAGMKEYPYQKAKRALSRFSVPEIESLSERLLGVYHDGHAGVRDIDLALEEWVLTV